MKINLMENDNKSEKNNKSSSGGLASEILMNSSLMQQRAQEQERLFNTNSSNQTPIQLVKIKTDSGEIEIDKNKKIKEFNEFLEKEIKKDYKNLKNNDNQIKSKNFKMSEYSPVFNAFVESKEFLQIDKQFKLINEHFYPAEFLKSNELKRYIEIFKNIDQISSKLSSIEKLEYLNKDKIIKEKTDNTDVDKLHKKEKELNELSLKIKNEYLKKYILKEKKNLKSNKFLEQEKEFEENKKKSSKEEVNKIDISESEEKLKSAIKKELTQEYKEKHEIKDEEVNSCFEYLNNFYDDSEITIKELISSWQKSLNKHIDIQDKFKELKEGKGDSFNDWFHSFANTLTLLSNRKDIKEGKLDDKVKKLLKFELTKHQIQATYSKDDNKRLERQTSPLVNEGYARGIRTGLWESYKNIYKNNDDKYSIEEFEVFPTSRAFSYNGIEPKKDKFSKEAKDIMIYDESKKIQFIKLMKIDTDEYKKFETNKKQIEDNKEKEIDTSTEEYTKKMDEDKQKEINSLVTKYATKIEEDKQKQIDTSTEGYTKKIDEDKQKEINSLISKLDKDKQKEINSLISKLDKDKQKGINSLISKLDKDKQKEINSLISQIKNKKKGKIDSFMGGEGLRISASESSNFIIDEMIKYIKDGKVNEALKLITEFTDDKDKKNILKKLAETNLDVNTMIVLFEGETNNDDISKFSKKYSLDDSILFNKSKHLDLLPDKPKRYSLDDMTQKPKVSTLDTLLQSSEQDLKPLEGINRMVSEMSKDEKLPFYIRQNLSVLYNLAGKNLVKFFDKNTPSKIMADFVDTIKSALIIAIDIKNSKENIKDNFLIEKFYHQMQKVHHIIRFQLDWKGDSTSLDKVLKDMLPIKKSKQSDLLPDESKKYSVDDSILFNKHEQSDLLSDKPKKYHLDDNEINYIKEEDIKTYSAPHGLAMISQIDKSLGIEDPEKIGILHGSYYETPDIFAKQEGEEDERKINNIDDPTLKDRKLIVMEPHPNNAAEDEIIPHNPVKLIKKLFSESSSKHTIIMDVTLNHLGEKEIEDVLNEAQPHINSGKLNLILLQSGTKFFQNGMDLVNIGTAVIFNKGNEWIEFNKNMKTSKQDVPKDDSLYIANMLSKNKDELKEYLNKVRENTQTLRKKLNFGADSAFELLSNSDNNTVYIAFQLRDEVVKLWLGLKESDEVNVPTRAKVNQEVYKDYVIKPMNELPSVDRSSFGFNVTNLGECYNTVRITLGIEDEELLDKYANNVIDSGKKLLIKAKEKK